MKLLSIDKSAFERDFEKRGFKIVHNLTDHPLFALPRLVELARALPATSVEYNAGNVNVSQKFDETPRTGLSAEETIRRIQEANSWMVLKNVEQDAEYKSMLDVCLNEIEAYTAPLIPGMQRREGFIFVSSPNSVTPFHLDPEHNFLLQVHGTKVMYQFTEKARDVVTEEQIERALRGPRNIPFEEEFQKSAKEWPLAPGEGLSVPLMTPHWVKNGPGYSVSFSVTWRSEMSLRREAVHRVNGVIRKTGVTPKPVGKAKVADTVKFAGYQTVARVKKVVKK